MEIVIARKARQWYYRCGMGPGPKRFLERGIVKESAKSLSMYGVGEIECEPDVTGSRGESSGGVRDEDR